MPSRHAAAASTTGVAIPGTPTSVDAAPTVLIYSGRPHRSKLTIVTPAP